nr:hypothetical protein [Tanacetum cinerariifolium]
GVRAAGQNGLYSALPALPILAPAHSRPAQQRRAAARAAQLALVRRGRGAASETGRGPAGSRALP